MRFKMALRHNIAEQKRQLLVGPSLGLFKSHDQRRQRKVARVLYARDVRGKGGQHIELSMYDVGFAFNWVDIFADHYFAGEGITHEPSDNPLLSHRIKDPE